ncbi:MAG: PE-PPE domain-containing protein [Gordonia sp. (in: high G+C Gram-positive bacteria)]|uniref:PE-PPE domain-containing protein n=1 Tax=Gordonia sp. (in: high G+C Gram-positive bacteria) TaxID=84139 RepID=UPI0039E68E06
MRTIGMSVLRNSSVRKGTVVLAAAALVGSAGLLSGVGNGTASAFDCSKSGAVFSVPGTNDPGGAGMTGAEQRYRGNGYDVVKIEYKTTLWPLGSPGYDEDVRQGIAETKKQIAAYNAECNKDGDKKIVVIGYSQGARIAGDVLSDIGTGRDDLGLDHDDVSGELWSDPRRDGDKTGRGIEVAFLGVIPGLTMNGKRDGGFGDVAVNEYCRSGDGICDLPDIVHDPAGVINSFIGYFTRHTWYPSQMGLDYSQWTCDKTTKGKTNDCFVEDRSTIAELRNGFVNDFRHLVGLPDRTVIDFWSMIPNADHILPNVTVSDLQPVIKPVLDLLPQLPQLGYGGYLPDLFMFTDILNGVVNLDPGLVGEGVKEVAGSLLSIVKMPVVFVDRWGKRIVTTVEKLIDPKDTESKQLVSALGTSAGDDATAKDGGFTLDLAATSRAVSAGVQLDEKAFNGKSALTLDQPTLSRLGEPTLTRLADTGSSGDATLEYAPPTTTTATAPSATGGPELSYAPAPKTSSGQPSVTQSSPVPAPVAPAPPTSSPPALTGGSQPSAEPAPAPQVPVAPESPSAPDASVSGGGGGQLESAVG